MTRKELEKAFKSNVSYATGFGAGAVIPVAAALGNLHSGTTLGVVCSVTAATCFIGAAISSSFDALRTSHRLAALESTGREAEPERPVTETSTTKPKAYNIGGGGSAG